ncbi:MAG: 4Fe-4S binding protein [FCB group bacterium]|nr:4Fe-4S binding protein [FCB group bacterium]
MERMNRIHKKPLGERLKPDAWTVRNGVQLGFFLLTLLVGLQFALWVSRISTGQIPIVARPPGVEGFLPVGSLIGLKYWLLTGIWDKIHPAGMVILLFAILLSWLVRKSFCSWLCPIGTVSEWLWRLGKWGFGRNYEIPKPLDILFRSLKYLILFFFLFAVIVMGTEAMGGFLGSSYWKISDIKMLRFFTHMSALTGFVLIALVIGSVFIQNFWCRYLCPYGALTGLLGMIGPTRIQRSDSTCIDCDLCNRSCPQRLPVSTKPVIMSAECTACMQCVDVCPVEDTLHLSTWGIPKIFWTRKRLAIVVVGSFIVSVTLARWLGIWESSLSLNTIYTLIPQIDFLGH